MRTFLEDGQSEKRAITCWRCGRRRRQFAAHRAAVVVMVLGAPGLAAPPADDRGGSGARRESTGATMHSEAAREARRRADQARVRWAVDPRAARAVAWS